MEVMTIVVRCPFREEHLAVCQKFFCIHATLGKMSHHVTSRPPPLMEGYWWPISATAEGTDLIQGSLERSLNLHFKFWKMESPWQPP